MFIPLDYRSRTPIYEQIKEFIILEIAKGTLQPNEKLPSLRQLSSELSLNINTIKRAFSELESQGITYSVAGKGIFVSDDQKGKKLYVKDITENIINEVEDAKNLGVTKEQMIEIINNIYKGADEEW